MKKIGMFIVVFLIIIVGFFLVLALFSFGKEKAVLDSNNQNQNNIINNQETQSPEEDKSILEIIGDFLGIDSGGGGASSGDSTSPTAQDSSPTLQQISYSIRNFEQSSFCNQYQGPDCIDKTSDCSLIAENLDNQVTGIFEIKFIFSDSLNQELFSDTISRSISAGKNKTFESVFNAQGQDANQDISCSYATLKIPEKII